MDNFDLKKFLVENKTTRNSKFLSELQYYHNGSEINQVINYDDSDITDDLESLGQGSMDGQDFKVGTTYNIGGQNYKIEAQGDEFKLVLVEMLNEENQNGIYLLFDKSTGKLDASFLLPDSEKNDVIEKAIKDKGQHTIYFYTGDDFQKYYRQFSKFKGKTAQELGI